MNYQTRTNSSLLPCEHQHSGFQKLQKVLAKMMVTGPSALLVKDDPQAEKQRVKSNRSFINIAEFPV